MNLGNLLEQYLRLSYVEKRVLQLRYLTINTIQDHNFCRVVKASNLQDHVVQPLTDAPIKKFLEGFVRQKLLLQHRLQNPQLVDSIITEALCGKDAADNTHALLSCKLNCFDPLKIGVYLNNEEIFKKGILTKVNAHGEAEIIKDLNSWLGQKAENESWLKSLTPTIKYYVLVARVAQALNKDGQSLVSTKEIQAIKSEVECEIADWKVESKFIQGLLMEYFFVLGDMEKINLCISLWGPDHALQGIKEFLNGRNALAIAHLQQADSDLKKTSGTRTTVLTGIYGVFYILSLLKEGCLPEASTFAKQQQKLQVQNGRKSDKYFIPSNQVSYDLLEILVKFLNEPQMQIGHELNRAIDSAHRSRLDELIFILVSYWTNADKVNLMHHCNRLHSVRNRWPGYGHIIIDVDHRLQDKLLECESPYKIRFSEIVKITAEWDRAITALDKMFRGEDASDKRLAWRLALNRSYDKVVPIEQTRKKGFWSAGKEIQSHKLSEYRPDHLTKQDTDAIWLLDKMRYRYNADYSEILVKLIGHPLVFDGDKHVELAPCALELEVQDVQGHYQLKLANVGAIVKKENERIYRVKVAAPQELALAKIIGTGISVPAAAKEKVFATLQKACEFVEVKATINDESLESVPAQSDVVIQLMPAGDIGLNVRIFTRPFPKNSMVCVPGQGLPAIVLFTEGNCLRMARNFVSEINSAEEALKLLPTLEKRRNQQEDSNDYEWNIDTLEESLEMLSDLESYTGVVEWPKGKPFEIEKEVSFNQLKFTVSSKNQWFEFDGQLQINETKTMDMTMLLSQLSSSQGRFIKLDDKRFVALKASFYKRLQELNIAATDGRINRLGSSLISEFAKESNSFESDDAWCEHLKRIDLSQKHDPKVCKTLQASLRPYQEDGYKWLSRLCFLKCGAALCDDMGLGKTLQAITLLLEQAKLGPCLVIAPASVCYVWEEECKKFAPNLKVSLLSSDEREAQIKSLGKMNILVVSYGLLPNIEDAITQKEWQVIVLDEAQAIKNFSTKRFQVVTRLKSANRVALSGTPIENRLFELWSLFEFLNPGLLGNKTLFHRRYVKPIEQDKNAIAQATLKKLVQPFILRRTKEQVLTELPEKTEQTVFVEPSDEEKSFYEALRRKSLERIDELSMQGNPAKKSFGIFTEIVKLKRACCDSSLIDNSIEIANSKLKLFEELVDELRQNGHKALVFSQYVDYLNIVRSRLDKKNISYQYLDGSTPIKSRKTSIEAFQSGVGDLFLISLKAGGTGLNLTAADYVIHLDPWWNPAVEEQASARAYRMGQTKHTTIYRFIMKHSIEEKILKMHNEKRELASQLLSGTDMGSHLTEEDLLKLILN